MHRPMDGYAPETEPGIVPASTGTTGSGGLMQTPLAAPLVRFLEVLPEASLLVSDDGTILAANSPFEKLLAWAPGALVGKPVSDIVSDRSGTVRSILARSATHEVLTPVELHCRSASGAMVDCRTESAAMHARQDGEPGIVLLRFRPAGDREAWFRMALSSIGDAVITTDTSGIITFMNPTAERLTGWSRAESRGEPLGTVFHTRPPGNRQLESPVSRALRDGVVHGLAQHTTLVHRDGTEFTIEDTAAPIRDHENKPFGVVIVFRDVADRRSLERELSRTAEELANAHRRKDEFLAMLGHELRNPLAPLRNGIEILRSARSEDPQLDQVEEMMERQVQHLTRLVDDLLDVSRITRGLTQLRFETAPLRLVLEAALETARPTIISFDHELNVSLPPDFLCVRMDVPRATQLFANLLINAAQYTPAGGRIALTASLEDDRAVVRIMDSGIGIPAELLPRIFDLFTQAGPSVHKPRGGLGIGLTVVKSLVDMHGGKVYAHSEGEGLGSEFVVELPVADQHPAVDATPAMPASDPNLPPRKRVLVVDDNTDAAESLALIIKFWGHDVRHVSSGEDALELATEFTPDVVLLDVGLPLMSGYEVARRMRSMPATENALIVAVTGYGRDEDRRSSRDSGIDQHMTKPVEPAVLRSLLIS